MTGIKLAAAMVLAFVALLAACGDETTDEGVPGCDVVLSPSDDDYTSVQTALIETPAQSTICFEPGTYSFSDELSLGTRGITLRGVDRGDGRPAVFDFSEQQGSANGMLVTGSDFTVEDLSIVNSPGDGIRVEGAENVVFRNLTVTWDGEPREENGAYAIYPVACDGVLVEDSEVSGASDAGIYVGQSTNAIVRNNLVHGNVAGIEIENTLEAAVYGNHSWDNTAGILTFNLPNLPVEVGGRTRIYDNVVEGNNRDNFAPEGNIVAVVPAGTGIMVLATDEIEIHDNEIRDNETVGVLVVSYFMVNALREPGPTDPDHDPYPEAIWIHENTYERNGTAPHDVAAQLLSSDHLEDIIWDGVVDEEKPNADGELDLCIRETGATFRNFNFFSGLEDQSTDLTPHECEHDSLPPLSL